MGRLLHRIAQLMGMSDAVWQRHANPWSGLTRMSVLPLLVLAIWSRVWIGDWAWLAVALALGWNWLNPRLFPPPGHWDHWMSRAVLGERIYIDHHDRIPAHHRRACARLAWASLPGVLVLAWGLIALRWEGALFGMALAILPKLWFLDRMVWLHADWLAAGQPVPGQEEVQNVQHP